MNDALSDPVGAREEVVLTRQEDALPFASDAADVAEGAVAREAGASASVPLIGAGTSFSPFVVRGFSDDEDLEDGCFVDRSPEGRFLRSKDALARTRPKLLLGNPLPKAPLVFYPRISVSRLVIFYHSVFAVICLTVCFDSWFVHCGSS